MKSTVSSSSNMCCVPLPAAASSTQQHCIKSVKSRSSKLHLEPWEPPSLVLQCCGHPARTKAARRRFHPVHNATKRTMVHVPVNNCHSLQPVHVLRLPRSDGDVVEVAEAHGPVALGVVPRRPHQRVRRPAAAAAAQPIVSLWGAGTSARAPRWSVPAQVS